MHGVRFATDTPASSSSSFSTDTPACSSSGVPFSTDPPACSSSGVPRTTKKVRVHPVPIHAEEDEDGLGATVPTDTEPSSPSMRRGARLAATMKKMRRMSTTFLEQAGGTDLLSSGQESAGGFDVDNSITRGGTRPTLAQHCSMFVPPIGDEDWSEDEDDCRSESNRWCGGWMSSLRSVWKKLLRRVPGVGEGALAPGIAGVAFCLRCRRRGGATVGSGSAGSGVEDGGKFPRKTSRTIGGRLHCDFEETLKIMAEVNTNTLQSALTPLSPEAFTLKVRNNPLVPDS